MNKNILRTVLVVLVFGFSHSVEARRTLKAFNCQEFPYHPRCEEVSSYQQGNSANFTSGSGGSLNSTSTSIGHHPDGPMIKEPKHPGGSEQEGINLVSTSGTTIIPVTGFEAVICADIFGPSSIDKLVEFMMPKADGPQAVTVFVGEPMMQSVGVVNSASYSGSASGAFNYVGRARIDRFTDSSDDYRGPKCVVATAG